MTALPILLALASPAAADVSPRTPEALMHADDEAVRRGFTKARKTIPAAFQGVFRRTLAECSQETETALTVGPTGIRMPGKDGEVQDVRVEGPRKIVVTAIYEGGGEVWEKTDTLLLSRDGRNLAFQLDSGPYTRQRCP